MRISVKKNSRLTIALLGLFVFAAAFLVYAKTLDFKLTGLDDSAFIHTCAGKYASKTVLADAFKNNVLFGAARSPYYRPALGLSFALSYKAAGESEKFAHFVNVLLHCASALLIFFFARRYLFPLKTSFFAALLFALHPAAIYAAAWIPGRNDSVFLISFLAAFIFFIEYLRKNKPPLLAAHIFFTLACFFTKESGIIIPLILFFYLITHKEDRKKPLRGYITLYILWALSALFFLYMRKSYMPDSGLSLNMVNLSADNIGMFFDYYASMLFLRTPLGIDINAYIIILGAAAMLLTCFFAFHKTSRLGAMKNLFYLCLPLLFLLPNIVSERIWFQGNRMYLPLFGIIVLFFSFFSARIEKIKIRPFTVSVSLLLFLLFAAITQNGYAAYKDALSFWGTMYEQTAAPTVITQNIYTALLIENGDFEKAYPEALKAAERTGYANHTALYNLADCLFVSGDYGKAAQYYEEAADNAAYAVPETYAKIYLCCENLAFQEAKNHYYGLLLKLSQTETAAYSYIKSAENFLNQNKAL